MTTEQLLAVKCGDRVWIGTCSVPRSSGVRTVAKTTPTQIVIDWNGDGKYLPRFHRGDERRAGYQIGSSIWNQSKISGVATKAECAAWDDEQRVKQEAEQLRQKKEQQRAAKQAELSALFAGLEADAEIDQRNGSVRLALYGLSQVKVRWIAARLAEVKS